ncbi:MAG: Sapep family Mn(2+)-dependent dipeptidase [Clostridiales bacterium]|jgi:succinyl-diaminopimelate desuccinylase|nr:Sapep family Mn(2+)-dependent dipeptidase [Clostridiales bacterium]
MQKYIDEMISSLKKLISVNSVAGKSEAGAPFGSEINRALKYALELSERLGFRVKNLDGYCGYAETGEGEIFAVLCHLDVVPFNRADWKYDPLGGEIDGGRLYGRGALDDKGPTIAALFAVKRLMDEGFRFKKTARFVFGLDEEGGEWKSIDYYRKKEGMPPSGIAPDADFPVINSEKGKVNFRLTAKVPANCPVLDFRAGTRANIVPDNAHTVVIESYGLAVAVEKYGLNAEKLPETKLKSMRSDSSLLKISAAGRAAHGAHPENGDNAAVKLLKFFNLQGTEPFASMYARLSDYYGGGLKIACRDDISGPLTVNAGIFEMSDPSRISVEIDVRYPHNTDADIIADIIKKDKLFSSEKLSFHKPLYIPAEDTLIQTLLYAYNKVTGESAAPVSIGGATFARALDYGAAFGPVFPGAVSTIHEANENIAIADFLKVAEIYYEAFKNLL